MGWLASFLIGTVVWVAVLLIGAYVFDVHPSLAEIVLVAVAAGLADGVREGLR